MNTELTSLLLAAVAVSCLHTLTGPDHYVPFIALSKMRSWSVQKTVLWTLVCGLGHVGSSIVLGLLGGLFGWSISKISGFEDVRGGLASWSLLFFGLAYLIWGLWQAYRNKPHKHFDTYDDAIYVYEHRHGEVVYPQNRRKVTPWVMFLIFVLGPCEPLIPMFSFPAARHSTFGLFLLIATFTVFTLLTMVSMVLLGYYGFSFFRTDKLERYVHALGGAAISICGVGMVFLGW